MKKKIAILGSCISRDPFSFFPDDRIEIVQFVARTSPISLVSPPRLDVTIEAIAELNNFETRCIHDDFTKTSLAILDKDFDYLILDFIEDRFDIAQIGDTYIVCSPNVLKSGVLNQFSHHRIIPRSDPEVAFLWAKSWLKLLERIREKGIENKLILNCGVYCRTYLTPEGETKFFDSNYTRFAETNQILINSYHGLVRASLNGVKTINVDSRWRFAASDHKWGLQPFHYIDGYYRDLMDKLYKVINVDASIAVTQAVL